MIKFILVLTTIGLGAVFVENILNDQLAFGKVNGIQCNKSIKDELASYSSVKEEIILQSQGLNESEKNRYFDYVKEDSKFQELLNSKECLELKNIYVDGIDKEKYSYPSIPIIDITITAISIFISVYFAFHLRNRHTKSNGKKTIFNELLRIEDILNNKLKVKLKDKTFNYVSSIITTTGFDSIVSSGSFNHFSVNQQKALDEFYFHIKEHNLELINLNRYVEQVQINEVTTGLARLMKMTLEHFEQIEKEISSIMIKDVRNALSMN